MDENNALLYTCTKNTFIQCTCRYVPGKTKINMAAKPPVKSMMLEILGIKRARVRERINQTTLITLRRMPS